MEKKRQIINIINFIRDFEPRFAEQYPDSGREYLLDTTKKQIELIEKYQFSATFLLQYDALIDPNYQELMKSLNPDRYEIGIWCEIGKSMTDVCGIEWTGRWDWDWHCHCDFPFGYTKKQREELIDAFFAKFKEVFGYYPRVFGSWMFDSHTVRYMNDKYGLDAICNCKEQYGTDGYTLWGSYYGQAYYPSRTNIFMPAQTSAEKLDVPLFRMLGSDPVYQYDFGMSLNEGAAEWQGVVTLEPVYVGQGGGDPKWVDWFLRENYNGDCLTFGYAQAGQENPFGWKAMEQGLIYQFAQFDRLQKEGKITVEKFGDTGKWFKETYRDTPPSAITAHDAYDDEDKDSVWYSTKHYRINLYGDHRALRIRDVHIFDETYADPFENTVCTENGAVYETMPWVDGNRYTGNGILAGLVLIKDGVDVTYDGKMTFEDLGGGKAEIRFGDVCFLLEEDRFTVSAPFDFILENRIGKTSDEHMPDTEEFSGEKKLVLSYDGNVYGIGLEAGVFTGAKAIRSENGRVTVVLAQNA